MPDPNVAPRPVTTRPAESWAWIRSDARVRLLPFAAACAVVFGVWRPGWLGLALGDLLPQLLFGLLSFPVMFAAAARIQLGIGRRHGLMPFPTGADALLQAGYFLVNAPVEEAFFRGLVQGGLGALTGLPGAAFVVATAAYVLYHRLGGWGWVAVASTALAGVPLGLAFWFLPGPPSVLGVSISHVAATCGFLGPGAYLMRRLRIAA